MYCLECESEMNLLDQEYCQNCGEVPERAMCGRCDKDFPVSLFDIHVCNPTGQPVPNFSPGLDVELSKIEIGSHDRELLSKYFAIQDSQRELDAARKLALGELFGKFSDYDFLTVNGQIVGKVMNLEYLALDIDMLRYKYPEVHSACLVKIRHQRYIKRPGNLI
jgi:hypothetical protein